MLNTRDEAMALLRQYNKEPFHILHALTVEGVMAWACCTTSTSSSGLTSTARRLRSCCGKRGPATR